MLGVRLRGRRATVIGSATVALLVAGGFAVAAIPGPGGTITGCYSNTDGSLRVVNAATDCSVAETVLTWNQTGPAGSGIGVLAGAVDFVDAADATGYVGPGGQAQVAPTVASGNAIMPMAGTVRSFKVAATPTAASGMITFTLLRNNLATPITCTITAPAKSCVDAGHEQAFSASHRMTVRVQNATNNSVRFVRWTAQYP